MTRALLWMWSQILYWIGQCGNKNKIVFSQVSVLTSGLVASQVICSFCKLETGLRRQGCKSVKWWKHPALCDGFYGWMPLKSMSLSGGRPVMRVLGGDQHLTVFKRWLWAVLHSPHCFLTFLLKHLSPILWCIWSSGIHFWAVTATGQQRALKKKSSLNTLGLNQGYHEITQLSAITVLPSALWTIFAILLWCKNAKLF